MAQYPRIMQQSAQFLLSISAPGRTPTLSVPTQSFVRSCLLLRYPSNSTQFMIDHGSSPRSQQHAVWLAPSFLGINRDTVILPRLDPPSGLSHSFRLYNQNSVCISHTSDECYTHHASHLITHTHTHTHNCTFTSPGSGTVPLGEY